MEDFHRKEPGARLEYTVKNKLSTSQIRCWGV